MQFTILINQVKALEWGLNFQLAGLFAYLHSVPSWARHKIVGGQVFYQITPEKVMADMPLLTDKKDTVYRAIRRLQELGLVHLEIVDKVYFIRISAVGNSWNSTEKVADEGGDFDDLTEKNPPFDGKKSVIPRKKIRQTAEKNPSNSSLYINNYIISNPTTSTNKNSSTFSEEDLRLAAWFFETLLAVDNNHKKPSLPVWAKTIRLMRERDNRTHREMAEVWQFARGDPFWQANVLCPQKLRDQFDRLRAKMRSPHGNNQQRKSDYSVADRAARQSREILAKLAAGEVGDGDVGAHGAVVWGALGPERG